MGRRIFLKLVSFGDEYTVGLNNAIELLGNRLKVDIVNKGKLDTSNERIFNDVIKYVTLHNDCDILLIGWTSPYRFDIDYDNKIYTIRKEEEYPTRVSAKLKPFEHVIFNEILVMDAWATLCYSLQEFLKAHNVNYYMYNTQEKISYNTQTDKNIRNLDPKRYHNPINKESSQIHFIQKHGHELNSVSGASAWARFLHAKMKAVGVV